MDNVWRGLSNVYRYRVITIITSNSLIAF